MHDLVTIERRIALAERLERPICGLCGAVLAGTYFVLQWRANYIATYTWMIPAAIGYAVPLLGFSAWITQLEKQRRAIMNPEPMPPLPPARDVSQRKVRAPTLVSSKVPEHTPAADPDQGPRFLG